LKLFLSTVSDFFTYRSSHHFRPALLSIAVLSTPGALADDMDWVEDDSPCCGHYQAPETSNIPQSEEIEITGDASQITENETIVIGNVEAVQGLRYLSGDKVTLYKSEDKVDIEGNALLREPGLLLTGESAIIHRENQTIDIDNATYVLHDEHAHGRASAIHRESGGLITLEGGTYSYCSPVDPTWELRSQSLELDPESGQGKGKHIRLAVQDVPILYLPYIQFPLGDHRQSGFLAPSFAYGDDGLDFTLPYYLNLAPNYDATIIPRYIADRGTQLGGEFRHLSNYFASAVRGAYLPNDDQTEEDRWLANLEQDGGGRYQPWRTILDITRVSDEDYFDDLDSSGLSVNRRTHLRQRGLASYATNNWDLSVEALNYQSLRDDNISDPYKKLPEFIAAGNYVTNNGFELLLDNRYAKFDHRDDNLTVGNRVYGKYDLSWNSPWQAGFIKPGVNVQFLEQQLEYSLANDDSHSVTVPAGYFDSGLFFQRHGNKFSQTFEPRLFYYYSDYEDQSDFQLFDTDEMTLSYAQLYRDSRFSGVDRIDDANQTTLGFSSVLLHGNNATEIIRLNMGQTFYHEDRRITTVNPTLLPLLPEEFQRRYTDDKSPLVTELRYNINQHWYMLGDIAWNTEDSQTQNSSVYLHYQGSRHQVFSIGYRHRRSLLLFNNAYSMETIREGDISTAFPLNNRWSLAARLNYDFNFNRTLEGLAGIEYDACCWRARIAYKKWATDDDNIVALGDFDSQEGIYFEIELKTLGSLGTKISSMLQDSIDGYGE